MLTMNDKTKPTTSREAQVGNQFIQGIHLSLADLIALRKEILRENDKAIYKIKGLSGQKLTMLRGRGIEFDGTREYQAGDDMRSMAWRVTARSLKPHIKVYQEEKERPVWLALDLSQSLYFGTRVMFKSVRAMREATLIGWKNLLKRERVGSMIANTNKVIINSPQASESHFMHILDNFTKSAHLPEVFTEENYLHKLLLTLVAQIKSHHLIYLFSDYYHFDETIQNLIVHLHHRGQIVLVFTYDPLEAFSPPPNRYKLTNGNENTVLNMLNNKNRHDYQTQFLNKKMNLIHFAKQHNIKLQIISTASKEKEVYGS